MASNKPWMQNFMDMGGVTGSYDPDLDPMDQARRWRQLQQQNQNPTDGNLNDGLTSLQKLYSGMGGIPGMGGMSAGLQRSLQRERRFPGTRESSSYGPGELGASTGFGKGGFWEDIAKKLGGYSEYLEPVIDAAGTIKNMYDRETFYKPMKKEEHAMAKALHGRQMNILDYNLEGTKRDEARNVQNQVRLWNKLSRQEGEAERTVDNWTPTTYA